MRSAILIVVLFLLATSSRAQQSIIYDDDCGQDVDCVLTLPLLFSLQDHGDIKLLAMVADSANPFAAPAMKIFAKDAGHPKTLIGANQQNTPDTALCAKFHCNESKWLEGLIAKYDPNGNRSAYPDCVTVYRKTLAAQPDKSVSVVVTGFATCLTQLLASGPDKSSPMKGADLVRKKVKLLSVMGAKFPSGKEWNFYCDAMEYSSLFKLWTKANGFPPAYINGYDNGLKVLAQPTTEPAKYAMQLANKPERPMWDMLSILFAARGPADTKYFTVSAPGTLPVDDQTGANSWFSEDSGHYMITNAVSDETFISLFQQHKLTSAQ